MFIKEMFINQFEVLHYIDKMMYEFLESHIKNPIDEKSTIRIFIHFEQDDPELFYCDSCAFIHDKKIDVVSTVSRPHPELITSFEYDRLSDTSGIWMKNHQLDMDIVFDVLGIRFSNKDSRIFTSSAGMFERSLNNAKYKIRNDPDSLYLAMMKKWETDDNR